MLRNILIAIVALGVGILAGWLIRGARSPQTETLVRTDTLTVRDTVFEPFPVPVEVIRTDEILVAVTDTVTVRDTVFMVLDREQKHYRGDDYEAWVSGYRPRLDSIMVFPQTHYITTTVTTGASPKRWGIGVQAGYGAAVVGGQAGLSPYIGVGVQWSVIQW